VIYLNREKEAKEIVAGLMESHNCALIAIGNGTACRETEKLVAGLIEKRLTTAQYCIVSEQGASIYSCSDVAKKEFPNLDVTFIGAISIARRLLDPLCELVKIEPKHIGVGMYQHDVNEKMLKGSLDEIVSECVSFVGVDLNVASLSLLKHVAGLTEKRAEAILKHREENGAFKSRKELMKVKSIGPKTFTQCAGFIRINALTAGTKEIDPLDSTNVHPESYDKARAIIKECGLKMDDIGSGKFVRKIQEYQKKEEIERRLRNSEERVSGEQSKVAFISSSFHRFKRFSKLSRSHCSTTTAAKSKSSRSSRRESSGFHRSRRAKSSRELS
jgi:competence ComEA-like helix-hairpin-helix protein